MANCFSPSSVASERGAAEGVSPALRSCLEGRWLVVVGRFFACFGGVSVLPVLVAVVGWGCLVALFVLVGFVVV